MSKVTLLLFASLVLALSQYSGSGIESVRVGMSEEAVEAVLKGANLIKLADPRDKTRDSWSYSDSAGINTVTFLSGKVVSLSAHTGIYHGEGRDLVKQLYALLYSLTKATPNDERIAVATVALREYPNLTGEEPIRHIELRFGDRHIDLTVVGPGSDNVALVGQAIGYEPSPTK